MTINRKTNWITAPTGTQVLAVCLVWLVAFGLLVVAMTDGFSEPLRNRQYFILGMLSMVSLATIATVLLNFYRNRRAERN
ncbi:MAG: hypothetical protein ACK5DD_13225 [Cyclobacteriaceae bacterium]|jgi:hypothetical protein